MASSNDLSESLDGDNCEDGVLLQDVLLEEEQLEADAIAVLGDSDDRNCTYPLGYLTRQALYACRTCSHSSGNCEAGVCLACSFACHDGHELFELYTKRNFRCDCGNGKFLGKKCALFAEKSETNEHNRYNQNFSGLYCTCARPYPDEDDEIEDVMIQCVVCEDWFHGRHLGKSVPSDNNYGEMICVGCMKLHPWLLSYVSSIEAKIEPENSADSGTVIDVEGGLDERDARGEQSVPESLGPADTKVAGSNECLTDACHLTYSLEAGCKSEVTAAFLPQDWRLRLCRCSDCMERYRKEDVSFLLDASDSVLSYEERGTNTSRQTPMERGMTALNTMNRLVVGEVVQGYVELKDSLKRYLKKFAENKKVVREEDIREFFVDMEQRKKRRLENIPSMHCK